MHIERAASSERMGRKAWSIGPWSSSLGISIEKTPARPRDKPHFHERMTEIYVVVRGTAAMRVEQDTIELHPNDVLVLEPGEAHTFLSRSPDYVHMVVHSPILTDVLAKTDWVRVRRSRLGLSRR